MPARLALIYREMILIEQLVNKIKNLIKRAVTTGPMMDTKNYPVVQVKYFNRTTLVEVLMPYGLSYSPPEGSLAVVFNILGQEENRAALATSPTSRFKNLAPGEVAVGNYITRAKIYFREDGGVLLDVPNGEVTIDTSRVTMTGDLDVDGDITAKGNIIDNSGTNTNNIGDLRTIYNSHTHDENDSGGPTEAPNQPM